MSKVILAHLFWFPGYPQFFPGLEAPGTNSQSLPELFSGVWMGFQEQMLDPGPGHPYSNTAKPVGPDCLSLKMKRKWMKPSPKQGNNVQFEASWGRRVAFVSVCILLAFCRTSCKAVLWGLVVARCPGLQMCRCKACRHQKHIHYLSTTLLDFKGKALSLPCNHILQHPFNEPDCTAPSCQPNKQGAGILFSSAGIPHSLVLPAGNSPRLSCSIKREKAEPAKPTQAMVGRALVKNWKCWKKACTEISG